MLEALKPRRIESLDAFLRLPHFHPNLQPIKTQNLIQTKINQKLTLILETASSACIILVDFVG